MNKKTLFFTIILLAVVSISSILAILSAQKITIPHINNANSPDFFMSNAVYTDFDQSGEIHSQISTTKITHFPTDDAYFFDKPNMLIFNPNEQPWNITANKGKSQHGKEKVLLWDNVTVHQPAGPKNAETIITTSELTISPKNKTASTDKPVTITQGGSTMSATGAVADFKAGTVGLLSKVKGKYK